MSATVANLSGNVRNGELVKTGTSDFTRVEITVSRECQAGFERTLVPKHQRCFPGIDDRIFSPTSRRKSPRGYNRCDRSRELLSALIQRPSGTTAKISPHQTHMMSGSLDYLSHYRQRLPMKRPLFTFTNA